MDTYGIRQGFDILTVPDKTHAESGVELGINRFSLFKMDFRNGFPGNGSQYRSVPANAGEPDSWVPDVSCEKSKSLALA
jgi:hypothetical protein